MKQLAIVFLLFPLTYYLLSMQSSSSSNIDELTLPNDGIEQKSIITHDRQHWATHQILIINSTEALRKVEKSIGFYDRIYVTQEVNLSLQTQLSINIFSEKGVRLIDSIQSLIDQRIANGQISQFELIIKNHSQKTNQSDSLQVNDNNNVTDNQMAQDLIKQKYADIIQKLSSTELLSKLLQYHQSLNEPTPILYLPIDLISYLNLQCTSRNTSNRMNGQSKCGVKLDNRMLIQISSKFFNQRQTQNQQNEQQTISNQNQDNTLPQQQSVIDSIQQNNQINQEVISNQIPEQTFSNPEEIPVKEQPNSEPIQQNFVNTDHEVTDNIESPTVNTQPQSYIVHPQIDQIPESVHVQSVISTQNVSIQIPQQTNPQNSNQQQNNQSIQVIQQIEIISVDREVEGHNEEILDVVNVIPESINAEIVPEPLHADIMQAIPQPINIETIPEPINIEEIPSSLNIETIPEPINIESIPEPINIESIPEHIDIKTTPEVINIETIPEPINIETIPQPIQIQAIPEPINIETVPEQINIETIPEHIDAEIIPEPLNSEIIPEPISIETVPQSLNIEAIPETMTGEPSQLEKDEAISDNINNYLQSASIIQTAPQTSHHQYQQFKPNQPQIPFPQQVISQPIIHPTIQIPESIHVHQIHEIEIHPSQDNQHNQQLIKPIIQIPPTLQIPQISSEVNIPESIAQDEVQTSTIPEPASEVINNQAIKDQVLQRQPFEEDKNTVEQVTSNSPNDQSTQQTAQLDARINALNEEIRVLTEQSHVVQVEQSNTPEQTQISNTEETGKNTDQAVQDSNPIPTQDVIPLVQQQPITPPQGQPLQNQQQPVVIPQFHELRHDQIPESLSSDQNENPQRQEKTPSSSNIQASSVIEETPHLSDIIQIAIADDQRFHQNQANQANIQTIKDQINQNTNQPRLLESDVHEQKQQKQQNIVESQAKIEDQIQVQDKIEERQNKVIVPQTIDDVVISETGQNDPLLTHSINQDQILEQKSDHQEPQQTEEQPPQPPKSGPKTAHAKQVPESEHHPKPPKPQKKVIPKRVATATGGRKMAHPNPRKTRKN